MGQRLDLNQILVGFVGDEDRVYFQPPNNTKMQYPCIVYTRDDERVVYADNQPYTRVNRYQVTVIDRNPDSLIPKKVAALPLSSFERSFPADDLNHDVYNVYF